MAIVQISKIIHRVGAQIDLPQLDTGEIGFASDTNKVYIGNDPIIHPPGNPSETTQTELLTDSSTLAFSQLGGASGTSLNLSNVHTGQLLVANADVWTNAGGNAGGLITLGTTSNIKISGGVNGYVLQTDGSGNLSWTTNGVIKNDIANIAYLSSHTLDSQGAVVVTTKLPHLFATGATVTIMGVGDSLFAADFKDSGVTLPNEVTGISHATNRFYIQRLSDTTFSLYTDSDAVTRPVNGTGWSATYIANTGYALGFVPATGNNMPGGSNTQIQFNDAGGAFGGTSNFTFNKTTNTLTVVGNIQSTNITSNVVGNLNGRIGTITPNSGSFTTLTTGNATITSNLIVSNSNTSSAHVTTLNVTGETTVANVNAANVKTDHLLYANGSPWPIAAVTSMPWSNVTGKPTFAIVATSGSYADLTNKPVAIPSMTGNVGKYLTTDGTSLIWASLPTLSALDGGGA